MSLDGARAQAPSEDAAQGALARRMFVTRVVRVAVIALFVIGFALALYVGPVAITPGQALAVLVDALGFDGSRIAAAGSVERTVLLALRLPRALAAALVGAALAASGAALQGLFRNPLADPQLIGVTSGAAVGAALAIVLGATVLSLFGSALLVEFSVSLAAFLGALLTCAAVYKLATISGRPSVTHMLLAGIALAAFGGATVGFLQYLADDVELRDLSLWLLGDVGRASWRSLPWLAISVLPAVWALHRLGAELDVSVLGDAAAHDLGVDIHRLRRRILLASSLAVGTAVACTGPIGFVGLAVPHILRLISGPSHKTLILDAALLGAGLLLGADALARIVVAPAQLPVGILTAILGAPLFALLLYRDLRTSRG